MLGQHFLGIPYWSDILDISVDDDDDESYVVNEDELSDEGNLVCWQTVAVLMMFVFKW